MRGERRSWDDAGVPPVHNGNNAQQHESKPITT